MSAHLTHDLRVDLFHQDKADAPKALSVTQLVRRMKNLLEIEIGEQWVEGEVSNLRKQASGHWYFSLKDDRAQISCAMFGARSKPGAADLEDGAKVRAFAEPSVYEARGQLQIIVSKVEKAGQGELQARFEALKRRLEAEGLFAQEHKKKLPSFPQTIGLITSGTGAAIRDMLNVLERRAPWVQPVLYPVRVQGRGAEMEIAEAISRMGSPHESGLPVCDLLIVGRGGGSLEDLWNFNEEVVARAIHACPLPVISAVGHEIDFTIADFVADLRAPTPSAAAELAVPDGDELRASLQMLSRRMRRRSVEKLERLSLLMENARRGVLSRGGERLLREPSMRLDTLRSRLFSSAEIAWRGKADALKYSRRALDTVRPDRLMSARSEKLSLISKSLRLAAEKSYRTKRERLRRSEALLRALSPESVFERGFSITKDADGRVIRSTQDIEPGQKMVTMLKDGEIESVRSA